MNNLSKDIIKLVEYAYRKKLLEEEDKIYAINKLCDLLEENDFQYQKIDDFNMVNEPSTLLKPLLDSASAKGIINPDTVTKRDILEAKIMDVLLPRPSEVNRIFNSFNNSLFV